MLGKLKSMIASLRDSVINITFLKGLTSRIEGQGVGQPIVTNDYNIESIVRTGVGVYEYTPKQTTFFGGNIVDRGLPSVSLSISSNPATDLHEYTLVAGVGIVTISVTAIEQGAGNRLDFLPYDLEAGDYLYLAYLVNAGLGKLPPE